MNSIQTARFKGFSWYTPAANATVTVGGAGGIGSWLTLFLSRLNTRIFLHDFDTISIHNIGGQFFRTESTGRLKTAEIAELANLFSGNLINTYGRIEEDMIPNISPACFSAFDNMEARKILFNKWKELALRAIETDATYKNSCIFIDGRLLGEQLQIYCVTPDNIEAYEATLFNSEDIPAIEAGCTTKQTSHSAAMIASHMTAFYTNFLANNVDEVAIREVPFFYEYFIPMNLTSM